MHRRRPRVALGVLTLMSAAVLMPGLMGARARAARVPCCPASRIDLSPAVYAVRQGRWQRTTTLTRSDEARFTLLFRAYDSPYFPGAASRWTPSSATLYITRASHAGVAQGPALYSVPLTRRPLPHGDTRFSRTLRLQKLVAGPFLASFIVTDTQGGSVGASIPFTVTPERPSSSRPHVGADAPPAARSPARSPAPGAQNRTHHAPSAHLRPRQPLRRPTR